MMVHINIKLATSTPKTEGDLSCNTWLWRFLAAGRPLDLPLHPQLEEERGGSKLEMGTVLVMICVGDRGAAERTASVSRRPMASALLRVS